MSYNDDELTSPDWLDSKFLKEVLEFERNDINIKINNFKIMPATAKGEHWASVMYRVELNYTINEKEIEKKSIIVKIQPEIDGAKKEIMGKSFIYDTEIEIYSKILPKFMEMQKNSSTNNMNFGPKILYYSKSPRYILVLEDLCELGYAVQRGRMANIEQTKFALEKLSKWHAISYIMIKKDSNSFKFFNHGIFDFWDWHNNITIRDCFQHFLKAVDSIPGFSDYNKKIQLFKNDLIQKCINTFKNEIPSNFEILNHGDFYLKNLMFKYNQNGKLNDILFVDYQMSVYGSVAIDLIYLLYCLIDSNTRLNHRIEIIDFYYDNFVKSLKDLQYNDEIPSRKTLDEELFNHRHLEIFFFGISVPFMYVMAFDDFEVNVENILQNNDEREIFFKNPRFLEDIKKFIPIFNENGYF